MLFVVAVLGPILHSFVSMLMCVLFYLGQRIDRHHDGSAGER
jgi:hypothetical protein